MSVPLGADLPSVNGRSFWSRAATGTMGVAAGLQHVDRPHQPTC
jgi:hypothetical protein